MIGPIPSHRPLNEWEAAINRRWIIRDLHREADRCLQVMLSMRPMRDREAARERRGQCYRLIGLYRRHAA